MERVHIGDLVFYFLQGHLEQVPSPVSTPSSLLSLELAPHLTFPWMMPSICSMKWVHSTIFFFSRSILLAVLYSPHLYQLCLYIQVQNLEFNREIDMSSMSSAELQLFSAIDSICGVEM
uniref:Uncharacterized protein n=1 Tax=Setaria viridis TaxID=4556 RepID=A0A4U6UZV7_SETVI|nr:hypothetical protein SEVIR_4G193500v2 [Setaria viridis]